VFGFFGLHAVLWFPRGFAERRRHRPGPPPSSRPPSTPADEAAKP